MRRVLPILTVLLGALLASASVPSRAAAFGESLAVRSSTTDHRLPSESFGIACPDDDEASGQSPQRETKALHVYGHGIEASAVAGPAAVSTWPLPHYTGVSLTRLRAPPA